MDELKMYKHGVDAGWDRLDEHGRRAMVHLFLDKISSVITDVKDEELRGFTGLMDRLNYFTRLDFLASECEYLMSRKFQDYCEGTRRRA